MCMSADPTRGVRKRRGAMRRCNATEHSMSEARVLESGAESTLIDRLQEESHANGEARPLAPFVGRQAGAADVLGMIW